MPRRGRAVASSASPVSIRATVFGPIPATESSRPAAAASRSSASVLIPSAWPSSRIRLVERPEQARHPDELRQRLRLELLQLRQLAGLHQLAQPLLDPGPDPGELAHATRADELRDVRRRRADQLGGAPVRADGVVPRLVQVEQGGEGFEPFGEIRVRHD